MPKKDKRDKGVREGSGTIVDPSLGADGPEHVNPEILLGSFRDRAQYWMQNPNEMSKEMVEEVMIQLQNIIHIAKTAPKDSDRLKAAAAFMDWARPITVSLGNRLALETKLGASGIPKQLKGTPNVT